MNEPQVGKILHVGLGFWSSKVLLSAVELELFTELAKHPETLEQLSARLALHPRGARDFLDALVALEFLERREGTYYNTPSTDFFLDKRKPSYMGGMLEMANHRLYPFWGNLTTALRTGEPQNEARDGGENPFKQLYADPDRLRNFLRAMSGISRGANMAIAQKIPLGQLQIRRRRRHRTRRPHHPGRSRQPAHRRHRLRPSRSRPHLRGLHRRKRSLWPRQFPPRQLLRRTYSPGRRRHDGPHPP